MQKTSETHLESAPQLNATPSQEQPSSSVENCVALPSGLQAQVRDGVGRDLKAATKLANGDSELDFLFCLMSVLCTIDGKTIMPEDIEDMSLPDVFALRSLVEDRVWGANGAGKSLA